MSRPFVSDEELFARYRERGDLEAFGQLYDRYASGIFRFLRRFLRDAVAAEDLTQQAFLRMHEARSAFDARRSFRTWAFTIARRLALNWRARGVSASSAAEDLSDQVPSPEGQVIARDELQRVERTLARLSRDDAEVLLLFKYEGLSHAEIGEVVGCSPDAAKMRVHRALKRFMEHLSEARKPEGSPD